MRLGFQEEEQRDRHERHSHRQGPEPMDRDAADRMPGSKQESHAWRRGAQNPLAGVEDEAVAFSQVLGIPVRDEKIIKASSLETLNEDASQGSPGENQDDREDSVAS
jgi:hypothetical protein